MATWGVHALTGIPIVGSITSFNNGHGDGSIVLVLGIAALIFVAFRLYGFVLYAASASLEMLAFTPERGDWRVARRSP